MDALAWALLVFLCSIIDDIGYVFFVRRVMEGKKLTAAILSAFLTAIVAFEGYMQYRVNPIHIIANTLGSSIGCPLAMYLDDLLPKRKSRTKQGRFKPIPAVAEFQQRNEVL